MSLAQLIELLVLAIVVFIIINKLLATLGNVSKNETSKRMESFFGGHSIKDVTNTVAEKDIAKKFQYQDIDHLIVKDNKEEILEGIVEIEQRLNIQSFSLKKFLDSAVAAVKMIIQYSTSNKENDLEQLIDKRYVSAFKRIISRYKDFNLDQIDKYKAKISEAYVFGNNMFIKIALVFTDLNSKEEWTFTKQVGFAGNNWYLYNIEK